MARPFQTFGGNDLYPYRTSMARWQQAHRSWLGTFPTAAVRVARGSRTGRTLHNDDPRGGRQVIRGRDPSVDRGARAAVVSAGECTASCRRVVRSRAADRPGGGLRFGKTLRGLERSHAVDPSRTSRSDVCYRSAPPHDSVLDHHPCPAADRYTACLYQVRTCRQAVQFKHHLLLPTWPIGGAHQPPSLVHDAQSTGPVQ